MEKKENIDIFPNSTVWNMPKMNDAERKAKGTKSTLKKETLEGDEGLLKPV